MSFKSVGAPLPAAEAAFLSHELGTRGIVSHLRDHGERGVGVEVSRRDLDAATALREMLVETHEEKDEQASEPGSIANAYRKATLAAVTGAVATLYLGRPLHSALVTVTALLIAALVFVAVVYASTSIE